MTAPHWIEDDGEIGWEDGARTHWLTAIDMRDLLRIPVESHADLVGAVRDAGTLTQVTAERDDARRMHASALRAVETIASERDVARAMHERDAGTVTQARTLAAQIGPPNTWVIYGTAKQPIADLIDLLVDVAVAPPAATNPKEQT